jgi:hypothetical protein
MQSPCHVPHYTAHVEGWAWYATSTASAAAAAGTATITMRSPAAFHTAGVATAYATLARVIT